MRSPILPDSAKNAAPSLERNLPIETTGMVTPIPPPDELPEPAALNLSTRAISLTFREIGNSTKILAYEPG